MDKGLITHNEARRILGYPDVPEGNNLMAQQQMFTLEALANRSAAPPLPSDPAPAQAPPQPAQLNQRALIDALRKEIGRAA